MAIHLLCFALCNVMNFSCRPEGVLLSAACVPQWALPTHSGLEALLLQAGWAQVGCCAAQQLLLAHGLRLQRLKK